MKDKDDKIAQALNMRSLQEAEDEKQEALDRLNPEKLPDIPINSFSTNDEINAESVDNCKEFTARKCSSTSCSYK